MAARDYKISIHALFAEGDQVFQSLLNAAVLFLSTPSSQRATDADDLEVVE